MTAANAGAGPSPTPAPAAHPPRRGRAARWLILVFLVLAAGAAAWSWVTLNWAYSEGERAGVLQKFSRKGWVCKTNEGELALYIVAGVAPQIWDFTVRDPAIAEQMNRYVGRRVQLHYSEHRGVPSSCFGDTGYFVDRITPADAAAAAPP
jgi:hypothetical protein